VGVPFGRVFPCLKCRWRGVEAKPRQFSSSFRMERIGRRTRLLMAWRFPVLQGDCGRRRPRVP
jgi:hypothetical protein